MKSYGWVLIHVSSVLIGIGNLDTDMQETEVRLGKSSEKGVMFLKHCQYLNVRFIASRTMTKQMFAT